jgi:hypothetical protein
MNLALIIGILIGIPIGMLVYTWVEKDGNK